MGTMDLFHRNSGTGTGTGTETGIIGVADGVVGALYNDSVVNYMCSFSPSVYKKNNNSPLELLEYCVSSWSSVCVGGGGLSCFD